MGALYFFGCVVMSSSDCVPLTSDSHRVRGVFSCLQLLSPVESSSLPSEALGAYSLLVRLGVAGCKKYFQVLRVDFFVRKQQRTNTLVRIRNIKW
jgi:hypothetical protein